MKIIPMTVLMTAALTPLCAAEPIRLHPDNPHYLLFRGKPTVLISSAEHYGAVLNLDFDYGVYLKEMAAKSMNQTRLWSGLYYEVPGSFGIKNNTLAPPAARYLGPWARSAAGGAKDGLNKFDLSKWNPDYFERLRDYLTKAGQAGVVVEYVLFCPFYQEDVWERSPMNGANNVNGVGDIARTTALTLRNGGLKAYQEAFIRKTVAELKDFDNLYYEICNEPWAGGAETAWEDWVASVIVDAEKGFPAKHLIAQNQKNDRKPTSPFASIYNYHYTGPDDVRRWYGENRPLAFDETGFQGSADATYRKQAWQYLLAGGAIFSNLDYSFTSDREDGTAVNNAPGGGSPALRSQLRILRMFMESLDFVKTRPNRSVFSVAAAGTAFESLAEPGKQYAAYFHGGPQVKVKANLPAGTYLAEWIDTRTGDAVSNTLQHAGGERELSSPAFVDDIALKILAKTPVALLSRDLPGSGISLEAQAGNGFAPTFGKREDGAFRADGAFRPVKGEASIQQKRSSP